MKKWIIYNLMVLIGVGMLAGCSSRPTEKEVTGSANPLASLQASSIEGQQLAAEQKAEFSTELTFQKKKDTLSTAEKEKIQRLLKNSRSQGAIKEVKVITWADSEYPSVHTQKLSQEERQLVENRNKNIENFLQSQISDLKIKSYSMAERPNALKDLVGSSDARIKKSLETAGIPNTDTSVKFPSKASKSIVLIILE